MKPNPNMSRIVGGKRYSLKNAICLASNEVLENGSYERNGRNHFLYRTMNGAYFQVIVTTWQGEHDRLEPISKEDAMKLYEYLPEKYIDYDRAFETSLDEA